MNPVDWLAPEIIWLSERIVVRATRHPSPTSPTTFSAGIATPRQEHLVEVRHALRLDQRTHLDAGRGHVER